MSEASAVTARNNASKIDFTELDFTRRHVRIKAPVLIDSQKSLYYSFE